MVMGPVTIIQIVLAILAFIILFFYICSRYRIPISVVLHPSQWNCVRNQSSTSRQPSQAGPPDFLANRRANLTILRPCRCPGTRILEEYRVKSDDEDVKKILSEGSEGWTCGICLEAYVGKSESGGGGGGGGGGETNDNLVKLPCGHLWHEDCMGKWIRGGGKNCPLCGHVVVQQDAQMQQIRQLTSFIHV